MADLEFTQGDFGDNYDISLYNKDGTTADITNYTAATLSITNSIGTQVLLNAKSLSIVTTNPAKVRWVMASTDTNFFGTYIGQVIVTGTGLQKGTYILSVYVEKKIN